MELRTPQLYIEDPLPRVKACNKSHGVRPSQEALVCKQASVRLHQRWCVCGGEGRPEFRCAMVIDSRTHCRLHFGGAVEMSGTMEVRIVHYREVGTIVR